MRGAINTHRGDRSTFQRGVKHPAQRIADRVPETTLERGSNELRVFVGSSRLVHHNGLGHRKIGCSSHLYNPPDC